MVNSWKQYINHQRLGDSPMSSATRSSYQVDYDRLIFSSPFRRLQNKTQVFPLPGGIFVHNRLTHSLEVASVGRSLGNLSGKELVKKHPDLSEDLEEFFRYELANVISAACLAHDIGNPAFGHSGEEAICTYFAEHADEKIEGRPLKDYFHEPEWYDLIHFEGNANSLRVLTQTLKGRLPGGFRMTVTTLASIAKYPCEAIARDKKYLHRKKMGFFQADKSTFEQIASATGMIREYADPLIYQRHPLVYLVEAADDICYRVVDLEDAHRLKIISADEITTLLLSLLQFNPLDNLDAIKQRLQAIGDANEKMAYLRAKSINFLTHLCAELFVQHEETWLSGRGQQALMRLLSPEVQTALKAIDKLSFARIYKYPAVIEKEIAGHQVLTALLERFVPALLRRKKSLLDENFIRLIPVQFLEHAESSSAYQRVFCALDYVSGMTDIYATDLYKKFTGISIGVS